MQSWVLKKVTSRFEATVSDKKSLYALYLAERTNKKIMEDEYGFATYSFTNDAVYIEDLFVLAGHRTEGHAAKLADKIAIIAKEKGLKKMLGSVCPSANGSTVSLKVLIAYGMKLESSTNDFIVMSKEI